MLKFLIKLSWNKICNLYPSRALTHDTSSVSHLHLFKKLVRPVRQHKHQIDSLLFQPDCFLSWFQWQFLRRGPIIAPYMMFNIVLHQRNTVTGTDTAVGKGNWVGPAKRCAGNGFMFVSHSNAAYQRPNNTECVSDARSRMHTSMIDSMSFPGTFAYPLPSMKWQEWIALNTISRIMFSPRIN